MKSAKFIQRQLGQLTKSMDLYSVPTQLLFKRQPLYSTGFGQLTSILVYFMTIFYFISLLKDLLDGANPQVVGKQISNLNPDKLFLDSANFSFIIGIADTNGNPVLNTKERSYFVPTMNFCHQISSFSEKGPQTDVSCQVIQLTNCLEAGVNYEILGDIPPGRLGFGLCPNKTQWDQVRNQSYIQGLITSTSLSYLSVGIFHCNKQREEMFGITCATDEQMLNIRNGFVTIIFTDNVMDPTKSTKPFQPVSKVLISKFTNTTQTALIQTLRLSHLVSIEDPFYFLAQEKQYDKYTLVQSQEKVLPNTDVYVKAEFYLDDKEDYYYRQYGNIITILGNIGGIFNLLVLFFKIVTKAMITKVYQSQLIYSIFSVETESQVNQNQTLKSRATINPSEKQIKNILKQKSANQPSSCSLFFKLLGDSSYKSMISEGTQRIENQLDAIFIMKKLLEIDKLKQFLLDEDQLKLFDYFPKDSLKITKQLGSVQVTPHSFDKSFTKTITVTEDKKLENKLNNAVESYHKLRYSNKHNDRKLIEMLSPDVKDLFFVLSPLNGSISDLNNQLDDQPFSNLRSNKDEQLSIIQRI